LFLTSIKTNKLGFRNQGNHFYNFSNEYTTNVQNGGKLFWINYRNLCWLWKLTPDQLSREIPNDEYFWQQWDTINRKKKLEHFEFWIKCS